MKPISIKEELIKGTLKYVVKNYSKEIAVNTEKIFRLETDNFQSSLFSLTYGPRMLAYTDTFPYGWNYFNDPWKSLALRPVGIVEFKYPNEQTTSKYLKFHSPFASIITVARFLQKYPPARFKYNDSFPDLQQKYKNQLNQIEAKFVNEIIKYENNFSGNAQQTK